MKRNLIKLTTLALAVLILYMAFIKVRSLGVDDGGPGLAVRWEGFYHDYNYRDVGESLNQCLGKPLFQKGRLLRSAGWFSGWSCDEVGNPDRIFSLNYSPGRNERYFCQGDTGRVIGRFFNPNTQLSDLEFPETWNNERIRKPTCRFIHEILQALSDGRKTLVHCSAGRDRTGTISALITALAAEEAGQLTPQMLEAIECDYRKTQSLGREKYGRQRRFIRHMLDKGGVSFFLQQQCGLDSQFLTRASTRMLDTNRLPGH